MALAQQLSELATANSQGLLNDEEYRLLRQNIFEQHSSSTLFPIEAPILQVGNSGHSASSSSTHRRVRVVDPPVEDASPQPLHSKSSITSSVANFLRRATGRKPSGSPHINPEPPSESKTHSPKRGVIPRMLQRKASEIFAGRADSKRGAKATANLPMATPSSSEKSHLHSSSGPSRSTSRPVIPTFPSSHISTPSSVVDIFDDGNLHTSKDIRAAIIATEAEAQRLLEAFSGLESSTSFRIQQQTARRLPSATPAHANVLIDGSDWRDHRPQPPPSPLASDRRKRGLVPSAIDVSDGASVRSGSSSMKTRLSQSKSVSSLRSKQRPGSPLSPRFPTFSPTLIRKNSVSSISSSRRVGVKGSISLSRSTGHLPLDKPSESEGMLSADTIGIGHDQHPEVSEIQRRREEVAARYAARLEFLQAKLKGAELHEKLMRR